MGRMMLRMGVPRRLTVRPTTIQDQVIHLLQTRVPMLPRMAQAPAREVSFRAAPNASIPTAVGPTAELHPVAGYREDLQGKPARQACRARLVCVGASNRSLPEESTRASSRRMAPCTVGATTLISRVARRRVQANPHRCSLGTAHIDSRTSRQDQALAAAFSVHRKRSIAGATINPGNSGQESPRPDSPRFPRRSAMSMQRVQLRSVDFTFARYRRRAALRAGVATLPGSSGAARQRQLRHCFLQVRSIRYQSRSRPFGSRQEADTHVC